MPAKPENLTDRKFGRLQPLKVVGRKDNGAAIWLCRCDCDNEARVLANNLKRGYTKSCGCWQSEHMTLVSKNNRWPNKAARTARDARIRRLRAAGKTLHEIGKLFDISHARVSQICEQEQDGPVSP